jgi:hypothetical protein
VLDSSMLDCSCERSSFLPRNARSSYIATTYYGINQRPVPQVNTSKIYHLQPYTENVLRTTLATVKNCHSCTYMRCKAVPQTWHDLRRLTQLLDSNCTELQRLSTRETTESPLSVAETRLLRDLTLVKDSAISYERSIERQAQFQISSEAANEAEEMFKQARSMERYLLPLRPSSSFSSSPLPSSSSALPIDT